MVYVNMAALFTEPQINFVLLTWHLCTSRNACLYHVPGSDVICEQIWRLCVWTSTSYCFGHMALFILRFRLRGHLHSHSINKRHVTVKIVIWSSVFEDAIFVYIRHVVKSHHVNKTTWLNSLNFRLSGHLHPHNIKNVTWYKQCHLTIKVLSWGSVRIAAIFAYI